MDALILYLSQIKLCYVGVTYSSHTMHFRGTRPELLNKKSL